jgi:hypothetical protein
VDSLITAAHSAGDPLGPWRVAARDSPPTHQWRSSAISFEQALCEAARAFVRKSGGPRALRRRQAGSRSSRATLSVKARVDAAGRPSQRTAIITAHARSLAVGACS